MMSLIQTLNDWGQIFCHHALWMLVQSGVLVAILWGLDTLLRRRIKASIRYAIWLLVLVKLVLPVDFKLPSGIGYWLHWNTQQLSVSQQAPLPKLPAPGIAVNTNPSTTPAMQTANAITTPTNTTLMSYQPNAHRVKLSMQGWILSVWLGGIVILVCGFAWQLLTVKGIISRSKPAGEFLMDLLKQSQLRLHMTGHITLKQSDEISGPAVCGLLRPVILIPTNLLSRLDKGQFEAVILHELSHIQRGDLWLNTVQTLFQIFYFYNPFVRLANHCIRKTREQANDECVLVYMNGRRDYYSAALVEVAAAVIGRPAFAVRLIGVAEPKNHLHERITLMMRKSIPTNAKIGFAGILVLLLLGAVLLPMAAGPKALAAETEVQAQTKSGVAPITQEQFLTGSQKVLQQILEGYSRADGAAIAAPYTQDAMLLDNENNMAIGKSTISAFYADAIAKGIRILSVDSVYHDIRVSGKYVFSVDKSIARVRAPGMKQLVLAYVKFLTIWEIQPDGSLKIKVDAINYDKLPDSELVEYPKGVSAVKDSFHCPKNNAQIANASKETLDKIRRLEKEFHAAFPAGNIDTIASHYAADIILLPEQDDFIRGREALKAHTEGNLRRFNIESVGDQIICAEGTEEMVFVVNTYLIKMKDKTQNNQELTIPCKGVHVWQKQPDGSWQIRMDIFSPNASQ